MPLPHSLRRLLSGSGAPWVDTLDKALDTAPSVSLRLNPDKSTAADAPSGGRPVAWCPDGYHLQERPRFTFDPAMHQGRYYVQDASSMFIGHVVRHLLGEETVPVKVLDACAAPGGKTTAIISALPPGSLVVANEYDSRRAAVLRENLAKWGYPLTAVTQGDTSRFRATPGYFDIIAADVPCSGEGMMRKDDEAVAQWSPELVDRCVVRQEEIVCNLWTALRPGGYLIYSTCTFNTAENEAVVARMIKDYGAQPVEIPVDASWGVASSLVEEIPAARFIPGLIEGEGLFMAVVRKPADDCISPFRSKKRDKSPSRQPKSLPVPKEVKNWLLDKYPARLSVVDSSVIADFTPGEPYPAILTIATLKGRDAIPSQQLAMSLALNAEAFPSCEVSADTAIDYLRCEAVTLPSGTPRGIVLLTYQDHPLGFVKNLGNRANNLYPKPWRILSRPQIPQKE